MVRVLLPIQHRFFAASPLFIDHREQTISHSPLRAWRAKSHSKEPCVSKFALESPEWPKFDGQVLLHFCGLLVKQGRPVLPLPNGVERCWNQQYGPIDWSYALDRAILADGRVKVNRATQSFLHGLRRIDRRDLRNSLTYLQLLWIVTRFRPWLGRHEHNLPRVNLDCAGIDYHLRGQLH